MIRGSKRWRELRRKETVKIQMPRAGTLGKKCKCKRSINWVKGFRRDRGGSTILKGTGLSG